MDEMEKLLKKQLFFTRIFAVSNVILVVIVLIFALKVLPGLTLALSQTSDALTQATETLILAEETLSKAEVALEDFEDLAGNVNELVDSSSVVVEEAMGKINKMDIDTLNRAIQDLSDVVEPLANFFNRFN